MGVSVESRDHGSAPGAPLTFRDRNIQLERGVANEFDITVYGGKPPYTYEVVSQSLAELFLVIDSSLRVNSILLTQEAGTEHSVVLKVTDSNSNSDTATWELNTGDA